MKGQLTKKNQIALKRTRAEWRKKISGLVLYSSYRKRFYRLKAYNIGLKNAALATSIARKHGLPAIIAEMPMYPRSTAINCVIWLPYKNAKKER